eukprot:s842_g19.t1
MSQSWTQKPHETTVGPSLFGAVSDGVQLSRAWLKAVTVVEGTEEKRTATSLAHQEASDIPCTFKTTEDPPFGDGIYNGGINVASSTGRCFILFRHGPCRPLEKATWACRGHRGKLPLAISALTAVPEDCSWFGKSGAPLVLEV